MKNLKLDQRVRYTRMVLRQSLMELLKQKPLKDVTVKELCERAQINRATFYSHYRDCYDLLHQIEDEVLDALFQTIQTSSKQEETKEVPNLVYLSTFRFFANNRDICEMLLGEHSDQEFLDRLLEVGKACCEELWKQHYQFFDPGQTESLYNFFASGCIGLLRQWIDGGMKEPPEEIALLVERLILGGIGAVRSFENEKR